MDISFDPAKRAANLLNRKLDFADAGLVFDGRNATKADLRQEYGEERFNTAGHLNGRCVVITWTPRDSGRRIISMRYAHADEESRWFP